MGSRCVIEQHGAGWHVRCGKLPANEFSRLGEAVESAISLANQVGAKEVLLHNEAGELHKVWPEPHP